MWVKRLRIGISSAFHGIRDQAVQDKNKNIKMRFLYRFYVQFDWHFEITWFISHWTTQHLACYADELNPGLDRIPGFSSSATQATQHLVINKQYWLVTQSLINFRNFCLTHAWSRLPIVGWRPFDLALLEPVVVESFRSDLCVFVDPQWSRWGKNKDDPSFRR